MTVQTVRGTNAAAPSIPQRSVGRAVPRTPAPPGSHGPTAITSRPTVLQPATTSAASAPSRCGPTAHSRMVSPSSMRESPAAPAHTVALRSLRTRRHRASRKLRKTSSAAHRNPTIPSPSRQPPPAPRSRTHPAMNRAPAATNPSHTLRSNSGRPAPASAARTRPAAARPTASGAPTATTGPGSGRPSGPAAEGSVDSASASSR